MRFNFGSGPNCERSFGIFISAEPWRINSGPSPLLFFSISSARNFLMLSTKLFASPLSLSSIVLFLLFIFLNGSVDVMWDPVFVSGELD